MKRSHVTLGVVLFLVGAISLASLTGCFFIRARIGGKVLLQVEGGQASGIPDVTLELYNSKGEKVGATFSDLFGTFEFPDTYPTGTYTIKTGVSRFGLGYEPYEKKLRIFKARERVQIILQTKKRN